MTEWIVTSSALILIILGLRFILWGRLSPRLQYGLWLLVLVRLLLPVSIPSSVSIMNVIPQNIPDTTPITQTATTLPSIPVPPLPLPEDVITVDVNTPRIAPAYLVWYLGMAVIALALILSNFHFYIRLRRTRVPVSLKSIPLPVYRTCIVKTPCLFGIVRPTVYLPPDITDPQHLHHILTHELAHKKQLDHIWGVMRCLCLTLHWYNPLVWLAVHLSKKDSELACDAAAIYTLGESQRQNYGNTLIQLTCCKKALHTVLLTTEMVSGNKLIKERIQMIAKGPKTSLITFFLVTLITIAAAGCTFTGQEVPQISATEPVPEAMATLAYPQIRSASALYMDDGVQGVFINVDGSVYVWDHMPNNAITPQVLDSHITYVGNVAKEIRSSLPEKSLEACRLPLGTKLYTGPDVYAEYRSVVYCQPCPGVDDPESYGRLIPADSLQGSQRWWEFEESDSDRILTVPELKALVAEKGALLARKDFRPYQFSRFGHGVDYWQVPVESEYTLLLVSAPVNEEVEVYQARLYRTADPDVYIDPITEDIDAFINQ